jgi:hypothetical protein
MRDTYEFMSREWLTTLEAILRGLVEQSKDELAGVSYAMNQVYTNPPPHLAQDPGGTMAGWWFRLDNGSLEFGTGEIRNVNMKLVAPYNVMLPLARLVRAEDPGALEKTATVIKKGIAAGTIVFHDDGKGQPPALAPAHDLIAKHTA